MTASPSDTNLPEANQAGWFSWVAGVAVALFLLKIGTPIIFPNDDPMPSDPLLWIFLSWPLKWGFGIVALLFLTKCFDGLPSFDGPRRWLLLPLAWYLWQWVARVDTVDPALTSAAIPHFTACMICLTVGIWDGGRKGGWDGWMWPILIGFCMCLWSGIEQHFWGLEEMRQRVKDNPELIEGAHPWLLARMQSDRIYGPLFYPNAYATGLVLLAPACIGFLYQKGEWLSRWQRWIPCVLLAGATMGCLFWTRSKTGILMALMMIVLALFRLPVRRQLKIRVAGALGVIGLIGFFVVFAGYFKKGATSLGARFHYWEVAAQITADHPFNGTGPATFQRPFDERRDPDSEMARLAHNDFLEQASDSGIPGFLFFAGFVIWGMIWMGQRVWRSEQVVPWATWIGLLGWAGMSLMEFTLYIPGVAWVSFFLFGVLAGTLGRK